MERHQGVPEPYIILDELVCDAIYDFSDGGDDTTQDRAPQMPPPPDDEERTNSS
jgi:hypothetical protein